ncbi:toprim domain-containing protein [Kribbella lupini]|uniref:DNA primase DNAG catalytic core N-terminal domain-containing protein n=1 Tax=Kribbella lupini TaxID=291602 RepID=A0ABN2CIC6_9ACTN
MEGSREDDELLVAAHKSAIRYYREELSLRPVGWVARHLRARRLGQVLEPGSRWKIGYAPDAWSHLTDHLRSQGFDERTMIAAGLAVVTNSGYVIDRFRDRIMFTEYDANLQPVGFIGRGRGGIATYLNTSTTSIYRKSRTLFGVAEQHRQLALGATPVLVEGTFDAVSVSACSNRRRQWCGVSSGGTSWSTEQIAMLRHYSVSDTVIVAFDGDAAGRPAAVRHLDPLSEAFRHVLVADLPHERDPSQILQLGNGVRWLRAQLENTRPLASLAIELELGRWTRVLDHAIGRVSALRAVAGFVAQLPTPLVSDEIGRLSRVLDLDATTVSREVLDAVGPRPARRRARGGLSLAADVDPSLPSIGL